jgi:hypothetical protein
MAPGRSTYDDRVTRIVIGLPAIWIETPLLRAGH